MAWVGVFHGKPQEVVGVKPEGETSEDFEWIESDDIFVPYINQDYIVDKNKVVPPSKEYLINQLQNDLATIRYNAQNYLVEYEGNDYLTNEVTATTITSKIIDAQLSDSDSYIINFKSFTGYVSLTFEDLKAIKQLITTHIQTCFDRESEILLRLDTIKDKSYKKIIEGFLEAVSTGWPLPSKVDGHY